MSRLNIDRQNKLESKRLAYAKAEIEKLGYKVMQMGKTKLVFEFDGCLVHFYPYSGWHSGTTIKDGRGLEKLIEQIRNH